MKLRFFEWRSQATVSPDCIDAAINNKRSTFYNLIECAALFYQTAVIHNDKRFDM